MKLIMFLPKNLLISEEVALQLPVNQKIKGND